MRICICDDDNNVMEHLSIYIKEFFSKYHMKDFEIACFADGASLLQDTGNKDIIFLDIELPGVNGIHVGQELKKANKDVIIFVVTSYAEYLDEAMRFHVFRYLSKPVDKQRLFRNLKDALQSYNDATTTLAVETKEGVYAIHTNRIVMIEAVSQKVLVHTVDREYTSIKTMHYWLQKLPPTVFFSSHRSFIVNFAYVTDFDHTIIHLYNNQFSAYLTRRKYTTFKNSYLLYLESTR